MSLWFNCLKNYCNMLNVSFIYPQYVKPITGGHIYEAEMIEHIKSFGDVKLDVKYLWNSKLSIFKKIFSPFKILFYIPNLSKKDIIFFNSTKGFYFLILNLILTNIYKKKTVVIHHHFLFNEFKGFKKKIIKGVELGFLRSAKHVLTPSPYIADEIKRILNLDPILCLIPFDKEKISTTSNLKINKNTLLYVGTVDTRKGISFLIDSLIILSKKNVRPFLHIVGKIVNQELYDTIQDKIKQYNLNVVFHGFVEQKEMIKLYKTSELFVFPSLMEGFGMSINEAMAYGLPVVCFNNSAMPYSVNNERGRLISDKNSKEFADAIEEILSNSDLRNSLSENALKYAQTLPSHLDFKNKIHDTLTQL